MSAYYPDTMQNILCTLADPVPDMITLSVTIGVLSWKEVADLGRGEGPCPRHTLLPRQEGLRVEEELLGTSTSQLHPPSLSLGVSATLERPALSQRARGDLSDQFP